MMRREPRLSKQQGFTLVELMVASVLGLVVLGGIMQIFISSKQAYLVHNNMAQMQENGRFALYFLHQYLSRADQPGTTSPALAFIDSGTDPKDQITASFQALSGGDGCIGGNYSSGASVDSTFFIEDDVDGASSLKCSESTTTANSRALVPYIEHLRFQYVQWDPVGGATSFSPTLDKGVYTGSNVIDAEHIYAVRVALISRSPEEVRRETEIQTYILLDQTLTKSDKYLRQIYTTTILLPNRMTQ